MTIHEPRPGWNGTTIRELSDGRQHRGHIETDKTGAIRIALQTSITAAELRQLADVVSAIEQGAEVTATT